MLSNLWSQIAKVEEDSSDDESSLSSSIKKNPLHADDIAAAALLTSFPPYGSHRKALTLDNNSSPIDVNNGSVPVSVSSFIGGDWDTMSPEKQNQRNNKVKEGLSVAGIAALFSFDDLGSDDGDGKEKESSSVVSTSKRVQQVMSQHSKSADAISWNDDELNLWSDSYKRKKRGKRYRRNTQKGKEKPGSKNRGYDDSILFNEEVKRQWIQGSEVAETDAVVGADAADVHSTSLLYHRQHNDKIPIMVEEDSGTTSTDDTSSEDGDHASLVARDNDQSDEGDGRAASGANASISNTLQEQLDEKSHWMPDVLCKTCYGCDAQFTVFRRRHHCRLCGQVFCSRCSSFFVEIVTTAKIMGTTGVDIQQPDIRTLRTCKTCYDRVVASEYEQNTTHIKEDFQNSARMDPQGTANYNNNREKLGGSIRSFPQVLEDKAHVSSDLDGFQGASSTEFSNLAIVKQKLEEDRMKRELAEKEHDERLQNGNKERSGPIKNISSKITKRFGKLAESAAREAQFGHAGYNDEESMLVGTGVRQKEEEQDTNLVLELVNKKESVMKSNSDAILPTRKHESSMSPSTDDTKRYDDEIKNANRQMRSTAADYLEKMGRELLRSDAPTLLNELGMSEGYGPQFDKWVSKLMTLATKCCVSVKVNIERGDALDIRPYCKVKAIPGGKLRDSVYVSGVVFHKNVSHKAMTRKIMNPRIMLLSGGIDYIRTEHRIASLNTLLEQEEKYLQILVSKITKLKPDILMVGRSVSRKAQELLLETNIVVIQHVKAELMDRIARQTGATILFSTDHIMNQFGNAVLGKCGRFRLVSFRDNDIWNSKNSNRDEVYESTDKRALKKNVDDRDYVEYLLTSRKLSMNQRQVILAANLLGEEVHDGNKAVRRGIQKRGVTQTYAMIEGCPTHLGCTIILRGASRPALKEAKRILTFLINVAYNLKLETSYFRTRRVMLPNDYKIPLKHAMSSSLCVDYGMPPQSRKAVRPWNGGNFDSSQRSLSGKVTALEHQSILISSVWMAGKTQCCPAEVKGICYYSQQDVSLGQFLRDSCFNLSLKCQNPNCKKSVLEHALSFVHNDGTINITVEEIDGSNTRPEHPQEYRSKKEDDSKIITWTFCTNCQKVVTPLVYMDDDTWKYSFGKFLEVTFYNKTVQINAPEYQCCCQLQQYSTLYFGCGNLAAKFTYERIHPYGVFLRRYLPFDDGFHKKFTVLELNEIMISSSDLFERFIKHIETTISDTRSLFVSAVNKPEHLQTLLSELHLINKEVSHASNVLKNKIVSVTNSYNTFNQDAEAGYAHGEMGSAAHDAFCNFPWHARRYLFLLACAWNERLSAIGQAVSAMKKVVAISQKLNIGSRSDIGIPQGVGADGELDEVSDAMQRLKDVKESYADFNVGEMDIQSNIGGRREKKNNSRGDEVDDEEFNNDIGDSVDDEIQINFSEEVDADVLASRRRASLRQTDGNPSHSRRKTPLEEEELKKHENLKKHKNKIPSRRSKESRSHNSHTPHMDTFTSISSRSLSPSSRQKAKAVSAGGAVKSALTRFFNRGGKEDVANIVNLGIFNQGRLRLEPGVGGVVIPVFDDQPSTIIAHSLASIEYESQFRRYTRAYLKDSGSYKREDSSGPSTGSKRGTNDLSSSAGGLEKHKSSVDESSATRRGRSERRRKATSSSPAVSLKITNDKADIEKRMLVRSKTHVKHTFRDYDEKGTPVAKFVCTAFWSTQFQAVRQAFLKENSSEKSSGLTYDKNIIEKNFVRSLSASLNFAAVGGKSGASFSKTADDRFIVKSISRTELQMFLDCAPAYFEYLSKAFFHGLPTMLCKIVGVFQIGYHNRETGKRTMEQVAVMQNIFFERNVSKVFDLKGSLRGRFAKNLRQNQEKMDNRSNISPSPVPKKRFNGSDSDISSDEDGDFPPSRHGSDDEELLKDEESNPSSTLLDGDFLEFTSGRPLPLTDRAKAAFHMSILNDTLFLSIINVLDYSILVGIDEEKNELVVGIIDFMRQYDILKQMERVGKSIPMVVGSEAPTIIQPPLYKTRFITAMERYFMTVPNKWTTI
mmetsp:Transcript_9237/g.17384  ORF Transcript_9237/g.17384 Transcript_9237/m.17384 type:complete len:2047 (+) Transcript_9237:105-6245(+)